MNHLTTSKHQATSDKRRICPVYCQLSPVNCSVASTTVESPLQIALFMQNKPNFRKSQMNVNKVLTMDYDNKTLSKRGKNKPNTNPIQTQSNPISEKAKMNVTSIITKGYENKPRFRAKAKQTQYKPNQTQYKAN